MSSLAGTRVLTALSLLLAIAGPLTACSLNRAPTGASFGTQTNGATGAGAAAAGGGGMLGADAGIGTGTAGAGGFAGTTAGQGGGAAGGGGAGTAGVGVGSIVVPDGGVGAPTVVCASTSVNDGVCRPTAEGVYALKSELDVWWKDEVNPANSPLMDPGRGKITIHFMAEISSVCDDGSAALTTLHTCGARLPPFFVDSVCKVIHIEFPDAMWDQPAMPRYYTRASVTGFNVGDVLEIAKVTGLLGIELPAIDATWPSYMDTTSFACPNGAGEKCFPDQDGDGHPGVTVRMLPGGAVNNAPYDCGAGSPWQKSAAPLSIGNAAFNLPGADTAYIGLRMALGGKGKLGADCQSGAGPGESSATIPSRVLDCVIQGGGGKCSGSDAEFVDQNTPNFHLLQAGETPPPAPDWEHPRENPLSPLIPKVTLDRSQSVGPRTSVVRLGDINQPFNCTQVRAASFPPFE